MSDDLDARLREALRPVEPSAGFADRVLARVRTAQHRKSRRHWRIPASLAASILVGMGLYLHVHQQRETAAGLEARRQVIEALRLTDQKLDLAYQAVKETSGT
jgi:hypothetical protein